MHNVWGPQTCENFIARCNKPDNRVSLISVGTLQVDYLAFRSDWFHDPIKLDSMNAMFV